MNTAAWLSCTSESLRLALRKSLTAITALPLWLYGLMFLASTILLSGYRVYFGNQSLQLPMVQWLGDSSLYSNDPFVATLRYYCSALWPMVAFGAHLLPLEPLLFVLFIIEKVLLLFGATCLANALSNKSKLAAIGSMALFSFSPQPILGGGTIVANYLEQTGLAIPFLLLALASLHKSRPISWAIWLAIGFSLTPMYGAYAISYSVPVILLDSDYRRQWRKWTIAMAVFALLACPSLVWTVSTLGCHGTDVSLWLALAHARLSHHLYPLTWGILNFFRFGLLLGITAMLAWLNRYGHLAALCRHETIWSGVSVLWLCYAFVAAYVVKSPSMLIMHPSRGTDLWYCLAGVGLVSVFAAKTERHAGSYIPLATGFLASVFLWSLARDSSFCFFPRLQLLFVPRYGTVFP